MSMTVYTAHVYIVSDKTSAFYEIGFENERSPELAIKGFANSFINDFNDKDRREELIANAFDTSYGWNNAFESYSEWDYEEPYTLADEVESASEFDSSVMKEYKKFCNNVTKMGKVDYVLFAVDSNKGWNNYSTYWYDAMIFDFNNSRLVTVEWRGTELSDDEYNWSLKPFYESTAEHLIDMIQSGKADQIDIGDFVLYGKPAGKVTETDITGAKSESAKDTKSNAASTPETNTSDDPGARIISLIKRLDSIDFENKAFVFDKLDYVPVDGEFCGPDSPNHPIVKKVIEAGGLMRKNVSGKTDFLVVNTDTMAPGSGAKCRDALTQIDKGKNITIITLDNLLEFLK